MRSLVFEGNTWAIYEELREKNKQLHKKLCRILKEMRRENPTEGTGQPELLKGDLSGLWSRRLSKYDRLVYTFDQRYIYIFAIGGHYEQLK